MTQQPSPKKCRLVELNNGKFRVEINYHTDRDGIEFWSQRHTFRFLWRAKIALRCHRMMEEEEVKKEWGEEIKRVLDL